MKVILQNFRKHDFFSVDIEDFTTISGKTGEGKTSILEAIIFCLYGRDFFGKTGVDRYLQKGKDNAIVVVQIDGYEVKRVLTKKGSEIYLNGVKGTQDQINMFFGSLETILPGINPFYFMYEMSDTDKRNLFMKMLPSLDRKEIFVKKYGEKLLDKFLLSTEASIKNDLKKSEAIIDQNTKDVNMLSTQINLDKTEVEALNRDVKEVSQGKSDTTERDKLQLELSTINNRLIRIGDLPNSLTQYKQALDDIKKRGVEILQKYRMDSLKKTIEFYTQTKEDINASIKEDHDKLVSNQAILNIANLSTEKCGLCGQPLNPGFLNNRKEKLSDEMMTVERQIVDQIKHREVADAILSEVNSLYDRGIKAQEAVKTIEASMPEYSELQEKKVRLEEQLKGMQNVYEMNVEYEKQIRIKTQLDTLQQRINSAKERIQKLDNQTELLKPQIEDLNILAEALGISGVNAEIIKEQTKQLEKIVNQYLEGIRIETVRENKTNDNYKELFDIFYEDVVFKGCSFGERIMIASAFGMAIRDLQTDFKLPFFMVDEATVLSKTPLSRIKKWTKEKRIALIVTRIGEGKLAVENKKYV